MNREIKSRYRGINEPPSRPGLTHAIIGMILVALLFFALLVMWALIQPAPAPIIDRAPALERLEVTGTT